jgi:hypothetical protein
VRRYLRGGESAERQERPARRILDLDARAVAKQMFAGIAEGNAVVVKRELQRAGVEVVLGHRKLTHLGQQKLTQPATLAGSRVTWPAETDPPRGVRGGPGHAARTG